MEFTFLIQVNSFNCRIYLQKRLIIIISAIYNLPYQFLPPIGKILGSSLTSSYLVTLFKKNQNVCNKRKSPSVLRTLISNNNRQPCQNYIQISLCANLQLGNVTFNSGVTKVKQSNDNEIKTFLSKYLLFFQKTICPTMYL